MMIRISVLRRAGAAFALMLGAMLMQAPAAAQERESEAAPPAPVAAPAPPAPPPAPPLAPPSPVTPPIVPRETMPQVPPRVLALPPAPVIANPQLDHPAYPDLLDAIDSTVDRKQLLANGLATVQRQFEADPAMSQAEQESPGLIDELLTGMAPVLERQNLRVTMAYRGRMIEVLARGLTPEDAASIAAFYRSDIGRRLMGNVVANFDMEQTIASSIAEKPVSAEDVQSDITSAVTRGVAQLSTADLAEMTTQALTNPALFKLVRVNPQIQRLRAEMENEPLTPEEEAELQAMMEGVFARRFPE